MIKYYFTLFFAIAFGSFCTTYAQNRDGFSSKNLNYMYYPGSEIKLNYNISKRANEAFVYLNIQTLQGITLRNNYLMSYEIKPDYQSEEVLQKDTIPYQGIVYRDKNQFIFRVDLILPSDATLMLVHVRNLHNQMSYSFDIPLQNEFIFPRPDFMVKKEGFPLFARFINENDSIEFALSASNTGDNREVYAYYYKTDFKAADPPMTDLTQRPKENLSIEKKLALPQGSRVHLEQKGLYFIQSDTNSNAGSSFLVGDLFYPRLAHINDITGPLIYITTRAERERLANADDKKKELDKFWINLTKNPDNARGLIRNYYQRVREANSYFTGYKEGWKTDMGMIYILYGSPDEVYRDEEKEEWIYQKIEDIPKLSFSFMKVRNIFTDNHYVLVRSKDYERHWYRIVDMWRKGRFSQAQAKAD
jgi:GWxTD domain-containing protein